MTNAQEPSAADLERPYWRLGDEAAAVGTRPRGLGRLLRRMGLAAGPVASIVRQAAPRAALATLLLQAAAGAAVTMVVLATARTLQQLLEGGPLPERIVAAAPAMALLLAAVVVGLAAQAGVEFARAALAPSIRRVAEERLFEASVRVDLAAFDEPDFYDQLQRARDRGLLHLEGATDALVDLLGAAVAMAGALAAIVALHPALAPVLVLSLLPQGWCALHSARLRYASMAATISLTRHAEMMADLATERRCAAEIRAMQAQGYVLDEYRLKADALKDHLIRVGRADASSRALGNALGAAGLLLCFAALGFLLWRGWIALAAAGAAVLAIRMSGESLARFMATFHDLFEKGLYIADYREFLERAARSSPSSQGSEAPAELGCIRLCDVSFSYPGAAAAPALKGVSLAIRRGQTVALVGSNGSGKTTLAKLLAGLYRPSAGLVTWDGRDTAQIAPAHLADRVAMVLQEPVRWPGSAAQNVRVGRHGRADPGGEALARAAERALASEFVERLPKGWDTLLSKSFLQGHDLSGGQWQRLAIARALYRDAPLVIWDEPTASLDARAEHAVDQTLRQMGSQRIVVLITHRLAIAQRADSIFFLERGRLVEHGSHAELMSAGGRYAAQFRLQQRLHGAGAADMAEMDCGDEMVREQR